MYFSTKKFSFSSQRGFTLIELMIVMIILAMFVIGGVAAYGKFNARQLVITSGKEFLTNLRSAQSKSLGNVRTITSCEDSQLTGYTVSSQASNLNQYTFEETYGAPCMTSHVVKTIKLPSGVTFQSAFTMTFTGLAGTVNLPGGIPLMSVVLCNKSCASGVSATKYTLSVSSQGLIQDTGAANIP